MRDMIDVYNLQERSSIMLSNPEIDFGFKSRGELYRTIDLLVLPHQEETLNISALEALYCNVPMIIPRGGPTAEFIGESSKVTWLENEDLFIAPPNNTRYMACDAHEIADKIIFGFLEFSKAKGNTINRKTQKSFERFDWKKIKRDWINILH